MVLPLMVSEAMVSQRQPFPGASSPQEISREELCRQPLGLVAGNGQFPVQFLREAQKLGISVVAAVYPGETESEVSQLVSETVSVQVGQLGKMLRFFRRSQVVNVVFLGGIRRGHLIRHFRPDLVAMKVLSRVRSVEDDKILRGVAEEFEQRGFHVLHPGVVMKESVVSRGVLTRRGLRGEEISNAQLGWRAAKGIGALDIGQTVVVARGMVVAVEAIEGTDATILRSGELAWGAEGGEGKRRRSSVVVKLPKPQQDRRLDLPAVGPETIQSMKRAGASALVLESGGALLLDPAQVCQAANDHDMALVVLDRDDELEEVAFSGGRP
ncbi:UDP-2,3-diacylglucosamine diphosphatase LpxI [bacterium]|nr:UDP-2,3-diacylglucosamine diphosphatase LpxI [bacterium]